MRLGSVIALSVAFCLAAGASPAVAAGPPNHQALQQQRIALDKLSRYDGLWRGEATVHNPDGTRLQLVQTERVGPMLGGTLRVIEGRGHLADGTLVFQAFAVVSYAPATGRYNFRSHAQGYAGDFPLEVTDKGFTWSITAGPATLRYTSQVIGDEWVEVGERIEPGRPPFKTFEMRLRRIGDTGWPEAGAPGVR